MKVGIVTLPLHFNFGGILQAYALQEVLHEWGDSFIIKYYQHGVKATIKALLYRQSGIFKFVKKQIRYDFLHEPFCLDELTSKGYDVLVVGSDQVWRPCMGVSREANVNRYFLKTMGKRKIKKISYAASFGVDYFDFTHEEKKEAQTLIKDFEAVSVRETFGITLCSEYLGRVDAKLVLDPTMLLKEADYLNIMGSSPFKTQNKHCFIYLLDYGKADNQETVKMLVPSKAEVFTAKVERSILKKYFNTQTVEDWLAAIYNSDLMITDSFHGCVFSILFHKDFYVMENIIGGNARIYSLLSLFGLDDRLIDKNTNPEKIKPINWQQIDLKLQTLRKASFEFLSKALSYD